MVQQVREDGAAGERGRCSRCERMVQQVREDCAAGERMVPQDVLCVIISMAPQVKYFEPRRAPKQHGGDGLHSALGPYILVFEVYGGDAHEALHH